MVIFCEGTNSEPDYLKGIRQLEHIAASASLKIEIHPEQGVPLTLVDMAIERKNNNEEIDECWCVFDVEWPRNHPNLNQAIEKARSNDVHLAISNPCFEIWLLLHFKTFARFVDNADAERLSKKCDQRQGKSIQEHLAIYMDKRVIACKNARSLDRTHTNNGTAFPHNNPSSGMYQLLASLDDTCRLPMEAPTRARKRSRLH